MAVYSDIKVRCFSAWLFFEFLPGNNQTSHNPIVGLNSGLVYYQLIQSQFGTWNSAEIAIQRYKFQKFNKFRIILIVIIVRF